MSATRPTKRDAEIALAELLLRRDHGRQPGDGRQKFNELVDTWLEFKQRTAQPTGSHEERRQAFCVRGPLGGDCSDFAHGL